MADVLAEQEKKGGSAPSSAHSEPLQSDIEARRASNTTPLDVLEKIRETDEAHPINWSLWKKWGVITVYCLLQVYVTMTSTMYVSVETFIQERFPSTTQVVTLGQSMFIIGTAVGPVFLGPLSDLGGRKWVYVGSILVYAIFNIGCALAYNLPMLIIFCFLVGVAGSTALSNVAGTIVDLFGAQDGAGQPMALFVLSSNYGASIGSPIGEWIGINSSMGWRWIFYMNIIWGGAFALVMCFMPETLPSVVIARAVKKRDTHDPNAEIVAAELTKVNVFQEIRFVLTMALRIMFTEPIVIFLGFYNGFAYGLLFLYLDGVFAVFVDNNGLSYVGASLSYLNFCVGVTCMFIFVPVQTYLFRKDRIKHGKHRPEARFLTSLVTVWLFPVTLFWFAFTSNGHTSYWSPIVAGGVLGFCDPLLWLGMLNYLGDTYSNVAGSAVAAFLIPSFLIAAAMCHAGVAMFESMSSTWAFATLAFISLGLVALVYILYFFGPLLRRRSKLATVY
ncbi:vitamin b6 transporter bsu1 [Aureobasidium pullulans]|nr:vitamin b6 transporter bsu1 [Aureobasidium pullulans]